jgi:hypothetical protein
MKRFTPSELPICTVIDDQLYGTFMKDAPGVWAELQYHCRDCQETVFDEGPTAAQKIHGANVIDTPSDEYFTDFKILSWPMAVVEHIVEEFAKMTGSEVVLEEAVEADEK